jgi:L-glyceraldehyde 3-phosphate reductase
VLRDQRVASTLIRGEQHQAAGDNVAAVKRLDFSAEELAEIDQYAVESVVDL